MGKMTRGKSGNIYKERLGNRKLLAEKNFDIFDQIEERRNQVWFYLKFVALN